MTYKGQRTYLGVIVSKDVQDGRYYLHEVVDENGNLIFSNKSNAADTSDGRASLSGAFDTVVTTAFDDSIPQTPGGVNRGEVARRQKMVWEAAETGLGENGTKALRYVYNEHMAAQVEPGLAYEDAATAEYLKRMDPREVERLDRVTRALGARVRVVDSVAGGAANAQIRGSEILMDKHTKMDVVSYVLGHEFTHRIQDLAEGEYMAFRAALDQETLRYAAEDIQAIYQKEGREIDLEAALDEAAANMAGKLLEDGALLDEFIERNRENKTLLERMRDVIRAIWSKLTGAERRRAKTAEGKLTAALDAAAKNAKQGKTGGESETRYSIRVDDKGAIAVLEGKYDSDRKAVYSYLQGLVSDNAFSTVLADAQEVYIGKDLPGEYTQSENTKALFDRMKRDKFRAAHILDDMLLIGENAQWAEDKGEKHGKAAKNGWYYYTTRFAVPVFERDGSVREYTRYSAQLVVRNDADGKSYLYDVTNIQRESTGIAANGFAEPSIVTRAPSDDKSVARDGEGVKPKYSLKGTERVEDAAELRRENEELREKYEYWKKQTRRSQAGKVSEEVMLRRTRGLLRDYGVTEATMDSRTVAHKLQAVYDDIGSGVDSTTGGEMTFRAAKERVRHYNRAAVEEALERMKAQGK